MMITMSRRVSTDTECTSACFTCHPSLKQRAFLEWQIFAYLWDCKEFSQTEKPDLSQTKHELLVVKCLLTIKYELLKTQTQTVLVSAVPERGDAEGEGGGGPGGWRVQEAGGRGQQGGGGKEVSRTKWWEMLRKTISYPLFYSSRKCYQLESKKGSFFFDDKWPGSVANFLLLPEAQFVAMWGNVWQIVCLYAGCEGEQRWKDATESWCQ